MWNKFHIRSMNKKKAKGETVLSLLLKAGSKSPQSQSWAATIGTSATRMIFDSAAAVSCLVKIIIHPS